MEGDNGEEEKRRRGGESGKIERNCRHISDTCMIGKKMKRSKDKILDSKENTEGSEEKRKQRKKRRERK